MVIPPVQVPFPAVQVGVSPVQMAFPAVQVPVWAVQMVFSPVKMPLPPVKMGVSPVQQPFPPIKTGVSREERGDQRSWMVRETEGGPLFQPSQPEIRFLIVVKTALVAGVSVGRKGIHVPTTKPRVAGGGTLVL